MLEEFCLVVYVAKSTVSRLFTHLVCSRCLHCSMVVSMFGHGSFHELALSIRQLLGNIIVFLYSSSR